MHIGQIIRGFRKKKKMTLLELSQKSGVALATLSRVENEKMTGTLESHIHIAEALEVSLPDFYRDLVHTKKEIDRQNRSPRAEVFLHDKSASAEMLAAKVLNKKMIPLIIRIHKGGATHKEETKPGIEKFVYILDGKIEAALGDEKYILTGGDSLYFESALAHHFKNIGTGEARLITVTSPPA